jgi:hypothetical protein
MLLSYAGMDQPDRRNLMRLRPWIFYLLVIVIAVSCLPAHAQSILYGSAYAGPLGPATLYQLSMINGTATPVGPIGFDNVGALDFAPDGALFGVGYNGSDSVLITINPATGAGTLIGPLGVGEKTEDIAFRPSDGTLFASILGNTYTVNTSTGAATLVGSTPGFVDGYGLAFSGTTLYMADDDTGGGPQGALWTINQSTGAETKLVSLTYDAAFVGIKPRVNGMKFDPATGTLWASVVTGFGKRGTNLNYLGTINITTGFVSFVGSTVSGLDAVAVLAPAKAGYFTTYYSSNVASAPDETLRIVNDGSANPLYASIYVFDDSEELTQCCSCKVTADGLLSESVKLNLTANPLRGIVNSRGVIKVISSSTETDVTTNFAANTLNPGLRVWMTHIQGTKVTLSPGNAVVPVVASPYFVTETEAAHSNLSAGEQTLLQNLCMYDSMLSGKPCTCQPEDYDF